MAHWRAWLLVSAVSMGGFVGVASAASEVDILLNKLVEKGILTSEDAGQIRREVAAEAKAEQNPQVAKETLPDSSRNWKWGGDIRLRHESRNRTGTGTDVNRERIRFRYGFEAKVADDLKVGARLATGSTADPISTNQTFNTAFNHKTIVLDRAFVEYSPQVPGISKTKLTGGIIENPFWGVGQLVWDDDLNFDGAAAHLEKEIGPAMLFTNNGLFSIQTDITEAVALWATQGGVILKPFPGSEDELLKNFKLTGALAYYDYQNLTRGLSKQTVTGITNAVTSAGGFKGNSNAGGLFLAQDFNLLNPTIEVTSQYATIPFGFFGDWVHNTAVTSAGNGFQIGLKLGKASVPFDLKKGWEAGYYYEQLAPDATFGAFTDSDFGNSGTNHNGHVYWVKLATLKNSNFQFKYFNTHENRGSKNNADTIQMDWVTKF